MDISSSTQNLFLNKREGFFKAEFYVFIGISLPHEPHKYNILGNAYYHGLMVAHSKPHQILYRNFTALL